MRLGQRWDLAPLDRELVRAAGEHDDDRAVAAIARWTPRVDLDAVSGAAHPLLASVGARVARLELDIPERARLVGVWRKVWVENERLGAIARSAATRLREAEVDVAFGGGFALGPRWPAPGARRLHDGVLVVAAPELGRVAEVLAASGWRRVSADRWEPPRTDSAPPLERVLVRPVGAGTMARAEVDGEGGPGSLAATDLALAVVDGLARSVPGDDLNWLVDLGSLAPAVDAARLGAGLHRLGRRGIALQAFDVVDEVLEAAGAARLRPRRAGLRERLDATSWRRQHWRRLIPAADPASA